MKTTTLLLDGSRLSTDILPSGAVKVYGEATTDTGDGYGHGAERQLLDLTTEERCWLIRALGGFTGYDVKRTLAAAGIPVPNPDDLTGVVATPDNPKAP